MQKNNVIAVEFKFHGHVVENQSLNAVQNEDEANDANEDANEGANENEANDANEDANGGANEDENKDANEDENEDARSEEKLFGLIAVNILKIFSFKSIPHYGVLHFLSSCTFK